MRERLLAYTDKLLLRKRALIESVDDQLKNICQVEHSRHRSPLNFLVHLLAGLTSYCYQPKNPPPSQPRSARVACDGALIPNSRVISRDCGSPGQRPGAIGTATDQR